MDEDIRGRIEELERRAQQILPLIRQKRRPLFIEFAGTPKSGKTTALGALAQFLKRNKINVRVYQERASVSPLTEKGSAAFNTWVTCATLMGMLEALEDEKLDVFILDRGLFDGLVWNDWQEKTSTLNTKEAETFRSFVLTPRWWDLIDILFVMHCDPKTALEREYANQITLRGGSIMNAKTLTQLREDVLQAAAKYRSEFKNVLLVDTSGQEPTEGVMEVATRTLQTLEMFLDEEVLCIPAADFSRLFPPGEGMRRPRDWGEFEDSLNLRGEYVRRSVAEVSDQWVQIVPVCVIQYGKSFLTNLRHEPDESLDKTLANWTGGHVRRQDQSNGDTKWQSVITGLRREIDEELKLAQIPEPGIVGLVHTSEDARAARHLGVVFHLRLEDASVAAALDGKTIHERPNKHVTTAWMRVGQLLAKGSPQKEWSLAINEYLPQLTR
jgi:predicted NUDIX family phosphoesterase